MIYKNLSHATKTFYGITFKPGEEHEVPGCINDSKFIRLNNFTKQHAESGYVKSELIVNADNTTVTVQSASAVTKKSGKSKNKEEVITDGTNCS